MLRSKGTPVAMFVLALVLLLAGMTQLLADDPPGQIPNPIQGAPPINPPEGGVNNLSQYCKYRTSNCTGYTEDQCMRRIDPNDPNIVCDPPNQNIGIVGVKLHNPQQLGDCNGASPAPPGGCTQYTKVYCATLSLYRQITETSAGLDCPFEFRVCFINIYVTGGSCKWPLGN